MKKTIKIILVLAVITFTTNTFAEELGLKVANFTSYSAATKAKSSKSSSGDEGAAAKGNFIIQPDFNLGATYGYYYTGFNPGLTLNLEYFVHNYASVGGYAAATFGKYYYSFAVGARGVFHWWQLLDDKVNADLKSEKIDFYLPVHLGVRMVKFKNDSYYYDNKLYAKFNAGSGLGFRYYFVDKFGVNLEWGWMEASWAKVGLTVKL